MKVVCIGAGAIGGYFGGVLAEAGHEVSFVARGETLAALRQRGVLLSRGDEPARASMREAFTPGTGSTAARVRNRSPRWNVQVSVSRPVSYTHLDVYKRQRRSTPGRPRT
ncbi:hypothetical protein CKJ84_10660 [Corynebacterium sp. NML 120412]|uniref:ketopantoate reductase family protein n=1 Tax=Corynebacterium sp. NML 120412 TaxID=2029401 RepID=UPI000BAA6244|nr:hypothetical protein CKJ84_10660 [Corynebacterium sp. NML 120412]